jgi:hypothetical protein
LGGPVWDVFRTQDPETALRVDAKEQAMAVPPE